MDEQGSSDDQGATRGVRRFPCVQTYRSEGQSQQRVTLAQPISRSNPLSPAFLRMHKVNTESGTGSATRALTSWGLASSWR